MSSFDISVGGLQAQAAAIQVTSNNVANASTVGYKSRESLFVDQYFKAMQSGAAAGAGEFGTKRADTQGALKASTSVLDLAVQGQGMFRLSSQLSGDVANNYYSRNGSFSVDKAGYIVNANGLYLTGYQPNATLTGATSTIAALKMPPAGIAPLASTNGQLVANLDARSAEPLLVVGGVTTATPKAFLATDPSTFNSSTTLQVYDSKGLAHQISLFFKKVDATVVDDPRSLTTPKAAATAAQYEVYMQADGVTMNLTTAGNQGAATLGNAADTAASRASSLANAYAVATASANDKASYYKSTQASSASAVSALNAALGTLAAVTPSAALSTASPSAAAAVTAASVLLTANTDLAAARIHLGALADNESVAKASVAANSTTSSGHAVLVAAAAAATAAVASYQTGLYATATATQAAGQASFASAMASAAAAAPTSDSAASTALAGIAGYRGADANATNAGVAVTAALTDKNLADASAVAAATVNSEAVAKSRIGTLQFVDGQLLGSLANAAGSGQARAPVLFNAELSDANGVPMFNVALDLSGMTAFGAAFAVTKNSADGYASGDLASLSIDETGQLAGQYTNGMSLVAGKVVLASFNSEAGLEAASGSVFAETYASGAPVLGTGTSGAFGMVRSMMLEQSTTDMAAELVNLMIQQRNYQANSQGLQAANTLLTTAINLGR
jgi:flagellar hook protein FlgE